MTILSSRYIFIIPLLSFLISCNGQGRKGSGDSQEKIPRESLIQANKQAVIAENEQIDNMTLRYGWEMTETGTGLRYMIYKEGEGPAAGNGDKIFMKYTVSLITGEQIYSSEEEGILKFEVGKAEISGLDEAARLLKEGDQARFVMPSYLAYGLTGDRKKINHKATLIYDVEVISVRKKEN